MVKALDVIKDFDEFVRENGRWQGYNLLKAMLDSLVENELIEESIPAE